MDKSTLSNYGWIVIAVLVLSVMIALATPFGKYIENGVRSTTAGLFDTSEKAMNVVGMSAGDGSFESGSGEMSTTNLPAKGKTLEEYSWAEVQQIVQAGATTEYGFTVGSTKTLQINGTTKTATIIGLDHPDDGENTVTFMILSSGGIGYHLMNSATYTNAGGWKDSELRAWLNSDVLNSMNNKEQIKEVTKMTNNTGYQGTTATATSDKVFLLSAKEAGCNWNAIYDAPLSGEGTNYIWFQGDNILNFNDHWWYRSPNPRYENDFFFCNYSGATSSDLSDEEYHAVYPAFVIG